MTAGLTDKTIRERRKIPERADIRVQKTRGFQCELIEIGKFNNREARQLSSY